MSKEVQWNRSKKFDNVACMMVRFSSHKTDQSELLSTPDWELEHHFALELHPVRRTSLAWLGPNASDTVTPLLLHLCSYLFLNLHASYLMLCPLP